MRPLRSFVPLLMLIASFVQAGSLRGTVRDAATMQPVSGVSVTVHIHPDSVAMPTTSGEDGAYAIMNIRPNNTAEYGVGNP